MKKKTVKPSASLVADPLKKSVASLSGIELEYWVARAEGEEHVALDTYSPYLELMGERIVLDYTRNRHLCGEIIDREEISVQQEAAESGVVYIAERSNRRPAFKQKGQSDLEAAMRCFVASRFGLFVAA